MGLLVDPIPNSLNYHHKNCMADSEENYQWDLGSERVMIVNIKCDWLNQGMMTLIFKVVVF